MFLYQVNKNSNIYEQLVKQFGLPITLETLESLFMSNKLSLPPYDRATTKAALRVGLIRNRDNQDSVNAIQQALNDEDACAVIGNWAQDTLAEQNANQGKAAPSAAGNWLAIFQLLIQNLPSIIAMIMQLFPKPAPTPNPPQPQPQPTQPASVGK